MSVSYYNKWLITLTMITLSNFQCNVFCWAMVSVGCKLTIHSIVCSWFYKPVIPQSPPSHLRDYSTCNNARLEFSTIFVPSFDPNEWCLKNGLHSGGLNPGPLDLESSALITRPRLTVITLSVITLSDFHCNLKQ